MKKILAASLLLLSVASLKAQQYDGYTLYSLSNATTTYLKDTASNTFHTWTHSSSKKTGYSCYLTPGGDLWRSVARSGNSLTGGGMTGEIMKIDYQGNILWDYVVSSSTECAHHDICPLPNGNVLLIVYDVKSSSEATQAGCTSAMTIWSEKIIEVQPTGATTGTIVWQWNLWDHLCQEANSSKDNYVTDISEHPELYHINDNPQKDIWHMNGLDFNPVLNQISISAHNTNEIYVIDHSTTTAEAAGHSGGLSGKGGDFLYRWGNPQNYGQSGSTNFNVVHDAHFIPEGSPNAGRLVAINNKGISSTTSCIDYVDPPYNGYTYSYTAGTAFTPSTYTDRLVCNGGTTNMGNSEQFPNGNEMICLATAGTIYEVDAQGNTLWTLTASGMIPQAHRYTACFINNAAPSQPTVSQNGNILTASSAASYQWYLNGTALPGETNQSLTMTQDGIYVVRTTDSGACVYVYSDPTAYSTGVSILDPTPEQADFQVFPNPASGQIFFQGEALDHGAYSVEIIDAFGRTVLSQANIRTADISRLAAGMYHALLKMDGQIAANRLFSVIP